MEIISLREARERGLMYYFTGIPCKRGHVVKRRVQNASCTECGLMHKYACDKKNQHKRNAYQNERRRTDPVFRSKWLNANIKYAKDNPHKICSYVGKRRALKIRATPPWLTQADFDQMEAIYKEAARLTRETGIKHEVDHIYPLKGKTVCGLHVPGNLQILTKKENQAKGNRVQRVISRKVFVHGTAHTSFLKFVHARGLPYQDIGIPYSGGSTTVTILLSPEDEVRFGLEIRKILSDDFVESYGVWSNGTDVFVDEESTPRIKIEPFDDD